MKRRWLFLLLTPLLIAAMLPVGALAALPTGVPSSLEAPTIESIELKHYEDGIPYFEARVRFPQSVLDLDSKSPGGGSVFWDYCCHHGDPRRRTGVGAHRRGSGLVSAANSRTHRMMMFRLLAPSPR